MTKLIRIAIGLLLLVYPARAGALHMPPHLFEMVGGAEIIVSGEIEGLTDTTYVLKIDRVIVGKHEAPTIEVRKLHDWSCDWRYGPYEVGQKLVAFLKRDDYLSQKENRPIHRILGGSGAELPMVEGFIYLPLSGAGLPSVSLGRHQSLAKLLLNDLVSAIEGHRLLYRVTLGQQWDSKGYWTTKLERIPPAIQKTESPFRSRQASQTPLAALQVYSRKSILHRRLANTTEAAAQHLGLASIGWKLPNDDAQPEAKVGLYRAATVAPNEK